MQRDWAAGGWGAHPRVGPRCPKIRCASVPGVQRDIFKSKIHRIRVTGADVDYEGSITLDPDLMKAANILPYERVHVWNVTRGTRLETYAITGTKGAGECILNGAAAHLNRIGDLVIVATFSIMSDAQAKKYEPTVVFVDEHNHVRELRPERASKATPKRRAAKVAKKR
jgi:aspartate 1-decarboxylase